MPSDSDRYNCCSRSHSVQRVRDTPEEYCCIGCEQKVSDHETLFERATRMSRGAAVDEAYIPLADLSQQSIRSQQLIRAGATNHAADMDTIRKVCSETTPPRVISRVRASPAMTATSVTTSGTLVAVERRAAPVARQSGSTSDIVLRTTAHRK
jgi:hypothetical protein